jgi:integrating conjugative element protein (TIGR03746 family)
MRYRSENENLKSHIKTLRLVAAAELLLIAALWHGWESAKAGLRIHIPPDLRSGAVVGADDPQPGNVYAFARVIFQSVHYWPRDGQADYGKNIFEASYYLTPRFQQELSADMDTRGKNGELAGRVRSLQEMPGHGYEESRVRPLGNGAWVVTLDFQVGEYVRGVPVKAVAVSYPLRVVRRDGDPARNPWGLALDGYEGDGPRRIELESNNPPTVSSAKP